MKYSLPLSPPPSAPTPAGPSSSFNDELNEGWDWNDADVNTDDEELNFLNEDNDNFFHENEQGLNEIKDNDDNDDNNYESTREEIQPMNETESQVQRQLLEYISKFSPPNSNALIDTINERFQQKFNNNKALELCQYYHGRPHLTAYTIDTEVPRMEYQIIVNDETVLCEASEIQDYFKVHPIDNFVDDMLLRASNQSLLADIFPLICQNGKNNNNDNNDAIMVRNELLATAHATKCRFVLDMREDHPRTTQVDCILTISIPNQLPIANARFIVRFSPEPSSPLIQYQLVSIQPLFDDVHNNINNVDQDMKLQNAALTIQEMKSMLHQEEYDDMNQRNHHIDVDAIRDNFLQSIVSTQSGFKSALQEIDHVVNVKSKLNLLKSALPNLPTAEDIDLAGEDDDEVEVGGGHDYNRRNNHNQGDGQTPLPPLPFKSNNHQRHPPQQPPNNKVGRPIIGGLLMSGITQLAEAVTIPSEALYMDYDDDDRHHHQTTANSNNIIPKLYKRDDEISFNTQQKQQTNDIIPKLYRRSDEIQGNTNTINNTQRNQDTIPKLYRRNDEIQTDNTQMKQYHHEVIPKLYRSDDESETNSNALRIQPKSQYRYEQQKHETTVTNNNEVTKLDLRTDLMQQNDDDDGHGWSDNDDDLFDDIDEIGKDDNTKVSMVETGPEKKVMIHENEGKTSCTRNNATETTKNSSHQDIIDTGIKEVSDGKQKCKVAIHDSNNLHVQMMELMAIKLDTNTYAHEDFVYDEDNGIIPTRKRFVSHSDLLQL
jgi:hypothetical protein